MIRAGELNRTLTLLRSAQTQDEYGEPVSAPSVVATVKAARKSLRIADMQRSQLHAAVAEAKFLIRYRADVTPDMTVRYDGVDYSIIAIEEMGRKQGLALLVKEAV